MANAVWRVWVWEYERGWGSRPDFKKDFPTKQEALDFRREFNSHNDKADVPDWYMVAYEPQLVDLDEE